MHELDISDFKEKGWSEYEIEHAMEVLRKAENKKHPTIKLLDENLYWIFLVLALIGNIAFSLALLPAIITMGDMLYVVAGFTGVIFGTLCTTLLRSIDILDTKHHVIYTILVPVAGLVNFAILVNQANTAVESMGFGYTHSALLLGIIYVVFFFLPYALFYMGEGKWT